MNYWTDSSKIIISAEVNDELYNKKTPQDIKTRLTSLIQEGYVEIKDFEFGSNEFNQYTLLSQMMIQKM